MLLACPECHSSFRIKPDALGEGRIVRCSHCRYEWFAEPRDLRDEDTFHPDFAGTPSAGDPVFDLPESVEASERLRLAESLERAEAGFVEPVEAPPFEEEPGGFVEPVEDIDLDKLDDMFGKTDSPLFEQPRERRSPPYKIMIALLVLGIFLCVLVFLFIKREQMMETPVAGDVLAIAGVSHVEGIAFADITLDTFKIGTKKARYTIKGAVTNQSDTERPVPTVRIRLMNKAGDVVEEWNFTQAGTLKPGEKKNFNAPNLNSTTAREDEKFVLDLGNDFDMMLR